VLGNLCITWTVLLIETNCNFIEVSVCIDAKLICLSSAIAYMFSRLQHWK
jgi:hypothetical protein